MLLIEDIFSDWFCCVNHRGCNCHCSKSTTVSDFLLGFSVYLYNNSAWRDPFSHSISSS